MDLFRTALFTRNFALATMLFIETKPTMRIIPLSEGSFTIDQTKEFVPFDTASDDLQQRSRGSLLVEIQPFVVETSTDLILLDTGLGFTESDGGLQLHHNLLSNGINPMNITKVLLSHLHKDHAGGIALHDETRRESFLAFPQATYYVNRHEFDFAMSKGGSSYFKKQWEILANSASVVWLPDAGNIDGFIHYEVTGAHCPYHQVFWIQDAGETIFFGGDDAPQLQQMKNKFVAKYDFDGRKAMTLRTTWWEQAAKENWTMLFYHDIKYPTSRL